MAQLPIAGFALGEPAWFLDGSVGIVERVEFNPVAGEWQYFLDPLGGMFRESDLYAVNPVVDVPSPPPVLAPLPVAATLTPTTENLIRGIVATSIVGLLESQRVSQDLLEQRMTERLDEVTTQFQNIVQGLTDLIVQQQSEFESRTEAIGQAVLESGAEDTGSFFQRVGSFLRSPIDTISEAVSDYVLSEVRLGLNR